MRNTSGEQKSLLNKEDPNYRWRFIRAISETGVDLAELDPSFDKDYNPFQINTLLSRHIDTLAFAHLMNVEMKKGLTSRQHFYCLLRMVPKKKRWRESYPKPDKDIVLLAVSEYTKQSLERCREYMRFLSDEQLKRIVNSLGKRKNE